MSTVGGLELILPDRSIFSMQKVDGYRVCLAVNVLAEFLADGFITPEKAREWYDRSLREFFDDCYWTVSHKKRDAANLKQFPEDSGFEGWDFEDFECVFGFDANQQRVYAFVKTKYVEQVLKGLDDLENFQKQLYDAITRYEQRWLDLADFGSKLAGNKPGGK